MTRINLPAGSALNPTDPNNPGVAAPSGMVYAYGAVWVLLGNLSPSFTAAGNSWVATLNPTTLAVIPTELPGCLNAFAMAPYGTSQLIISCSNDYGSPGNVISFDTKTNVITQNWATGGNPGSIAIQGNKAFVGDTSGSGVIVIDLSTNTLVVNSTAEAALCNSANFEFVSGVAAGSSANAEVLVTCFDYSNNSTLEAIDQNGQLITGTNVTTLPGSIALAFAGASANTPGTDHFAIANYGANTNAVEAAEWASGVLSVPDTLTLATGSTLNAVSAAGGSIFVSPASFVDGSGNTSTDAILRIDTTGSTPALVDGVELPVGSDPWQLVAVDQHTVYASMLNLNQLAQVVFP